MGSMPIEPNFFRIKELKEKIGLVNILKNQEKDDLIVTFNQLMKRHDKIRYIFIFDEKSIEIFPLITFCNYFNIEIFKVTGNEKAEIQEMIKYAQMVCIGPNVELTDLLDSLESSLKYQDVFDDLKRIDLGKV